jgi:hypothetical protein
MRQDQQKLPEVTASPERSTVSRAPFSDAA